MKLPDKATKVFSGIIFDVYQWEQELFDGTFGTYEMLKRTNTLQVLLVKDDKIYLSQEEQPYKGEFFSFFGGRQEEGETPLDGVKRELLEETGFVASDWELYKIYEPYTKIEWEVHVFIARGFEKKQEPNLDAGEKIKVRAYSFEEFIDMVLSDRFWGREFALEVAKMKLDPEKLETFRKQLFL